MALFEALYGKKCRNPLFWLELSERKITGVNLVCETKEKVKIIQGNLEVTFDRQKPYVDLKRKDIEFLVGDKIFFKVSLWKKVLRFGRKGKLSPRFIQPYKVYERIGPVALPLELDRIHNVYHVSMLQRYQSDSSHILSIKEIEVQPDFTYNEELVQILAPEMKELRNKSVPLVKCYGDDLGYRKQRGKRKKT